MGDFQTGIIRGDPRKTCWKDYMYHGIWRRCRVSCEPEPIIIIPTPPPPLPRLFSYEGDCLPNDNLQAYYRRSSSSYYKHYVEDGVYYVENYIRTSGYSTIDWVAVYSSPWSKKMTYIAAFLVKGLPQYPYLGYTDSSAKFRLRNIGGDFSYVECYIQMKYQGGGWVVTSKYCVLNTLSSGDVAMPFCLTPFVKYDYDEATNKTTITVNDFLSCQVDGEYWIQPRFFLSNWRCPWPTGVDYQRVLDTS